MTYTPETSPKPEIPTIIPETNIERHKTELGITYLKTKNIDKDIHQKLRNKYVYENKMHNIYNLIVGWLNDKL